MNYKKLFPLYKGELLKINQVKTWIDILIFSLCMTIFAYAEFMFINGITLLMIYNMVGWFMVIFIRCMELALFLKIIFILAHKKLRFKYLISSTHIVMYPLIIIQQIFLKLKYWVPPSHILNLLQLLFIIGVLIWISINTFLYLKLAYDFNIVASAFISILYIAFSYIQILPILTVIIYSSFIKFVIH